MADVFISYSKQYVQLTRDLASDLEAKGLTVWWDTDLLAGSNLITGLWHSERMVLWQPRARD
jgi:TIR domain